MKCEGRMEKEYREITYLVFRVRKVIFAKREVVGRCSRFLWRVMLFVRRIKSREERQRRGNLYNRLKFLHRAARHLPPDSFVCRYS